MSLPITPETKIAEMLDAYPQLEEVLIRQSSHFKALQNPILRKTVAKVATIAKASQMSGIPVRRLVAVLREAVGQPGEPHAADLGPEAEAEAVDAVAPAWFDRARVALTIDADDLLAKGEVPLPRVNRAVAELSPGALLCVKSAFRPAPLLEALHKAGHLTYVTKASPEAFHTYVCPKPTAV
jgi:hypothetical protein